MDPTLREHILIEHRRAELQRLEDGWDGCGCSDCQALYKELDLTKYGARVIRVNDVVLIKAKRGQESVTKLPSDSLIPLVVLSLPDKLIKSIGKGLKHGGGRPQKPDGEPVSQRTLYRRQQKAAQGALTL